MNRCIKRIFNFVGLTIILLLNLSVLTSAAYEEIYSVGLKIYLVDGSNFFDDINGKYLIKYGIFSSTQFIRAVTRNISSWDVRYPISGEIISFSGSINNLSRDISSTISVTGSYVNVFINRDVIMVYTDNPEMVSNLIILKSEDITRMYLDTLRNYISKDLGLNYSITDVMNMLGGSIKVLIVETPYPGYDYNLNISRKIEETWDFRPEFIGGYSFEGTFGYHSFLIYLSCTSSVFNYSYTFDEVLKEIDKYFMEIFGREIPPIILEVLDECIGSSTDISTDGGSASPGNDFKTEYQNVEPILLQEYVVAITLYDGSGESLEDDIKEVGEEYERGKDTSLPPYLVIIVIVIVGAAFLAIKSIGKK